MLENRLTNKAKNAFALIPKRKTASAKEILFALKEVNGLGGYILNNKKINIPLSKKIDLNVFIKESYYHALKFQHPYVGTEHMLLALVSLTAEKGLSSVRTEIARVTLFPNVLRNYDRDVNFPILDTYGRDLNKENMQSVSESLVERQEYSALVSSLLLRNTNNVLLVGDKGVGKRSLIQILARNINTLSVPPQIAGYRVIEFDLIAFLTNSINKVGVDNSLMSLSNEIRNYGKVILFIKNFQNLFYTTSAGITMPMFYSLFKSALAQNDVKIITSLSTNLYEKITSENDHIIEDFTVVEVYEPTDKENLKILKSSADIMLNHHNVLIPDKLINYIYKRAKEQSLETKFPQKGIDILDYICAYVVLKKSKFSKSYKKLIDSSFKLLTAVERSLDSKNYEAGLKARDYLEKIETVLAGREKKMVYESPLDVTIADIKSAFVTFEDDIKSKPPLNIKSSTNLSTLSQRIKKNIIGQDKIVDEVVNTLVRSKLGLKTRKRPMGNFLFLGPTGVGKTELAKVLAQEFFGDKSLIRLDMSDFSEKHTVARLVGAPPGYVGYGEGGELTTKIESNPDSLVLFDEIEKAHPDVLNILLQIMEEGELSDARGHVFDFTKSVIILTSNLGTEILHTKSIGFDNSALNDLDVKKRLGFNLKKILKPELLNRFDEIEIFSRLSKEDQNCIINLLIGSVADLLKIQKVKLTVDNSVKEYLLEIGYSNEYGARSLRRTMEKELLDKIASVMLIKNKRPLKLTATIDQNSIVIS